MWRESVRAVYHERRWAGWSMRVAWLAVLLVGVGCRTVLVTASGSRDRETTSSAKPLSSTSNVAAAHSDIVSVAISTEPERDVRGDGDEPLMLGK